MSTFSPYVKGRSESIKKYGSQYSFEQILEKVQQTFKNMDQLVRW